MGDSSGEVLMVLYECAKVSAVRLFIGLVFAIAVCGFAVRSAHAVPCAVVHHGPLSDADKAYIAANYKTSEDLYRAQLAASPGDPASTQGLVHTLLREEKISEAADAVQAALGVAPNSAVFIELHGEVEYRQGEPWEAAKSAAQAFKLDPCNPRVRLLFARLSRVGSFYASARASVLAAHQLDPDDPEILMEWISTLPLKQRIAELQTYLAAPHGNDAGEQRQLKELLDDLKKLEAEPQKPCKLVSQVTSTRLPIESIVKDPHQMDGWGNLPSHSVNLADLVGLDVKLNDHLSQLEIDTGADGLVVTDAVAKRAGLRPFWQGEVGGIGDESNRKAYTAFADSIRIGDLEFQNCAVEVVNAVTMPGGSDGLIGADVFSDFLVTLDFPMRQVLLQPLPSRPGQNAGADIKLDTDDENLNDSGEDAHTPAPQTAGAAPALPKPAGGGPSDRYIAPEMKDYTQVYRVGHDLLIPTQLNGTQLKLFLLDTGSFATTISPQAAREFTKIDGDSPIDVRGLSGNVKRTYSVSDIVFHFADISQKVSDVVSFDTSNTSKSIGMEVSGFIGATALRQLTIHIDYRDGLVKFDYDPKRGYRY